MVTYVAVLLVILGVSYLAWRRLDGRYRRARTDQWALLLPVLVASFAGVIPRSKGAAVFLLVLVAASAIIMVRFPRLAAKVVPFALLLLVLAGLVLARRYWDWTWGVF